MTVLPSSFKKLRLILKQWGLQIWQVNTRIPVIEGGILLVVAGSVYIPLWWGNYPYVHSIGSNVLWTFQYGHQVLSGQGWPRWLEQSFASLGSPTFVFYPPISMIATVPFALLNWPVVDRIIGSISLAIGVMGLGSYGYARTLLKQRWLALLCACLAVLSPYFLINIYIRGALGEMWAMAWIPWILWADAVAQSGSMQSPSSQSSKLGSFCFSTVFTSLGIALVGLSHLPTILLFTGGWLVTPWIRALGLRASWHSLWKGVQRSYPPLFIGLGLASALLLPALLDQDLVNIGFIKANAQPTERFMLVGLWQDPAHLSLPHFTEHDFDSTLTPIFILTLTTWILAVYFNRLQPIQGSGMVLISSSLALVMMTDLSRWVYVWIPPLMSIQFSWRWLALAGAHWPFIWGILLHAQDQSRQAQGRLRLRGLDLGITAVVSLILIQGIWSHIVFWPQKASELNTFFEDRAQLTAEVDLQDRPYQPVDFALLRTQSGDPFMTDVSEYTPRTALGPPHLPPRTFDQVEWIQGHGDSQITQWRPGWRSLLVTHSSGGVLGLRTYAWPGWKVSVRPLESGSLGSQRSGRLELSKDQAQSSSALDPWGRLTVEVPAGDSDIEVSYQGTQSERIGRWLSGLSGLSALLYGRWRGKYERWGGKWKGK